MLSVSSIWNEPYPFCPVFRMKVHCKELVLNLTSTYFLSFSVIAKIKKLDPLATRVPGTLLLHVASSITCRSII